MPFPTLFGKKKPPIATGPTERWPLNLPLVRFTDYPQDTWTLEDAFQGLLINGENGSGKTSGSGKTFARKFLQNGFGGLVLCFKTDEADTWRAYLKQTGRESDGRFFGVGENYRFNFLEYEAKTNNLDFLENLIGLLIDVASIHSSEIPTGTDIAYWHLQKKRFLRNAISLILLADEPIRLQTLNKMIVSAPNTLAETYSTEWKNKSFLYSLLLRAEQKNQTHPEWEPTLDYWMHGRPALHEKTRSTIDSDFTGMFDPLSRGKIGELYCTTTNLTPDDIFDGKIVVIDLPVAKYDEIGQYAAVIWAQLFQRAVDRREYRAPHERPVFLWADEAHYFTIGRDARFQTTARSKGIATVHLTQNLSNFLDAYGRDGKHKVDTFLGNHATKIWHRNGDPTTNEWAAKVIAKETTYKHSISTTGSIHQPIGANSQTSVSEVEEDSCPPKEFIGLKNGREENNGVVEGIIFQSGRLWKKDQRWIVGKFQQDSR